MHEALSSVRPRTSGAPAVSFSAASPLHPAAGAPITLIAPEGVRGCCGSARRQKWPPSNLDPNVVRSHDAVEHQGGRLGVPAGAPIGCLERLGARISLRLNHPERLDRRHGVRSAPCSSGRAGLERQLRKQLLHQARASASSFVRSTTAVGVHRAPAASPEARSCCRTGACPCRAAPAAPSFWVRTTARFELLTLAPGLGRARIVTYFDSAANLHTDISSTARIIRRRENGPSLSVGDEGSDLLRAVLVARGRSRALAHDRAGRRKGARTRNGAARGKALTGGVAVTRRRSRLSRSRFARRALCSMPMGLGISGHREYGETLREDRPRNRRQAVQVFRSASRYCSTRWSCAANA